MDNRLYLLSACILSLLAAPLSVKAEEVQTILQPSTQQQLTTDLSDVSQQKMLVQDEIEATTIKIQELDQQIKESDINIQNKKTELEKINDRINILNNEHKRIETILNQRKDEFKERVSSYYRTNGQMSFLNVIFSVNSFGEFIDHFVAYDTIVTNDKQFIDSYIDNQNKVAEIKENVQVLQDNTIQEKADLEAIKKSQVDDKNQKETLSNVLEEKKKELEKEEQQKLLALEVLQKNGDEILSIINNNNNSNDGNQLINSIITPFIPDAQKLQTATGVPASITLGQIILESSGNYNGLSALAFGAKNLFGIKGTGTDGSVYMNTTEYVNGKKIITKAQFAQYKTYYDSMADHAKLLLKPRYQRYLQNVTSIVDYAQGIQDAGYATDPNYANKLLKIIYQYGLWKVDI